MSKTPLEIIQVPYYIHNSFPTGKTGYHISNQIRLFNVVGVYWYDGAKFYIGSFNGNYAETLLEATTFMTASFPLTGHRTPGVLIKQFKANLDKYQMTIHEVIRNAKLRNLDLEAWQNFLII